MVAAVQTPLHSGSTRPIPDGTRTGPTRYRKEILVKGPLHVGGDIFDVTDAYLDNVMAAFEANAIASPPIKAAPDNNDHTRDPFRRCGTVVGLHRTARGLDADLEPDEQLEQLITRYPDTGVSVLIEHDRTTGGGQHYPAALSHLLVTEDPVINNLGPWTQALAASHERNGRGEVLDLLSLSLARPATPTVDVDVADAERAVREAQQRLDALRASTAATTAASSPSPSSDEGAPADPPAPSEGAEPMTTPTAPAAPTLADLLAAAKPEDLQALRTKLDEIAPAPAATVDTEDTDLLEEEVTDDELDEAEAIVAGIIAPADPADDVDEEPTDTPAAIAASHTSDGDDKLALANAHIQEQGLALTQMRRELDDARWREDRDALVASNVPARLVELAKPFLHGSDARLALSNDNRGKVAAQVRQMLTEVSGLMKTLGLSHSPVGTATDAGPDADKTAADQARGTAVSGALANAGLKPARRS